MDVSPDFLIDLYRSMLRIRMVEEHMESLYHLDEMKTPIHLCIGQEAVAVGVCAALKKNDYVQSNHRGHGHYLAKGGDLGAMIAELYCRETGCSRGRGGSMHLVDVSVGHMGSSSIVGGGISIATGLGLAAQMKKNGRVCAVFFGDGGADEGAFYESVNFAALKKLPVIYVLENNEWSVCSRASSRQRGENIFHTASEDMLPAVCVDGNDVLAVYEAASKAVTRAREGEGPSFIECKTYRIRGHAGSYSDVSLGYRTEEELAQWEEKCPVRRVQERLLTEHAASEKDLDEMRETIDLEIKGAFERAQNDPLPPGQDVGLYVFKE